jgi:tetratricopeptide (TPR) repeat protein
VDTFKSLSERYARDPDNVEVLFKLGQKQDQRYRRKTAAELYGRILALDPGGTKGATVFRNEKVSYTQYARFNLGYHALEKKTDASKLKEFVKAYPDSAIVKEAYENMSTFLYLNNASGAEAEAFFQEYTSRFPSDPAALNSWVRRILRDKAPIAKGIELAEKAAALSRANPDPEILINLAGLYLFKGDKAKAIAVAENAAKIAEDRWLSKIAGIFLEAGREDRALAVYGPDYVRKNYEKGSGLTLYMNFWMNRDKNLESVLDAGRRAVELMPSNWVVWNWMSRIYLKQKNYPEALKAAEKALAVAPQDAKALFQGTLGEIKAKMGKDKKSQ